MQEPYCIALSAAQCASPLVRQRHITIVLCIMTALMHERLTVVIDPSAAWWPGLHHLLNKDSQSNKKQDYWLEWQGPV